jgi:hypothetical protein
MSKGHFRKDDNPVTQDHPVNPPPEPLLAAWIKWTMDFWEALALMGPGAFRGADSAEAADADFSQPQSSALLLWQAFFSLLGEPGAVGAVFQEIPPASDIVHNMAQTGWRAYFLLYQQWLAGGEEHELALLAQEADAFEGQLLQTWNTTVEQELLPLLELGRLAGASQCQLPAAQVRVKFHQYQASISEFLYLLGAPVKKALRTLAAEDHAAAPDRLTQDFKEYYRQWLRLLEGHYMVLLKSPEFARILNFVIEAMEDLTVARQELLVAVLEQFGLPTPQDFQELAREVTGLKRQVRQLAARLDRLAPAEARHDG